MRPVRRPGCGEVAGCRVHPGRYGVGDGIGSVRCVSARGSAPDASNIGHERTWTAWQRRFGSPHRRCHASRTGTVREVRGGRPPARTRVRADRTRSDRAGPQRQAPPVGCVSRVHAGTSVRLADRNLGPQCRVEGGRERRQPSPGGLRALSTAHLPRGSSPLNETQDARTPKTRSAGRSV